MRVLATLLLALSCAFPLCAQDSDHDGLDDALEQRLLEQFQPAFHIGQHDCSDVPAAFAADLAIPTVAREDGTIYGQVFLAQSSTAEHAVAEIHFYHLWRSDCGAHSHPLDTEHVAVLVTADGPQMETAKWHASYWFAAAHENTVCDVSQIARAGTLHAEEHGADVWVSPGKHASYLNETLCKAGCGNDRCERMTALHVSRVINLGELSAPMNGSVFVASHAWPLAEKMSTSNFAPANVARLEQLPLTDIAWYNPGRHPVQGVIAISSHTQQHIAAAGGSAAGALDTANQSANTAISVAAGSTGNALQKSYRRTKHALGTAAKDTGSFLHVTGKDDGTGAPK